MRLGYFTPATEPTHLCPYPLEADKSGGHLYCKKAVTKGCSSVVFETHGIKFSQVYGRIIGYRIGNKVQGFLPSISKNCEKDNIINTQYVDGISLTCGSPGDRKHIWTFVSAQWSGCRCVPFYRSLLGMTTSVNLKEVQHFIVDTLSGKAVVREAPAAALSHGFTSTSVRKPAAILR